MTADFRLGFEPLRLRPFFSYYGAKWRAAPMYPRPRHRVLVEPFAGSACYALCHSQCDVVLIERNRRVAAVWRYLIDADPARILDLPDIGPEGVDAHDLADAERWLIGFWLAKAPMRPRKTPSAWARDSQWAAHFWGERIRKRIASQVGSIRHWRIVEGNYDEAPDVPATWFVDPPYQGPGRHYPTTLPDEEYPRLAAWCRSRRGQVIVCEAQGADWLPFRNFARTLSLPRGEAGRTSPEAIWIKNDGGKDE